MVLALCASVMSGSVERVYVVREPTSGGQEAAVGGVVSVTVDGAYGVYNELPAAFGRSWSYAEASVREAPREPTFIEVITRVCSLPGDPRVIDLAFDHGLSVMSVAWEDTGRSHGSAMGPNISDVTIEVYDDATGRRPEPHLLPVIRHPNFRDVTADVPADRFSIRVGNAGSGSPRTVPLAQVIAGLSGYLSDRSSVFGERDDFSDRRDTPYLVSAQFVFVPLSESGVATFTPHIFNYTSRPGRPAVLTLVATREGTSITVIENTREDWGGRGQTLYFSASGINALYTAERRTSVVARVESGELDLTADPTLLDQNADVMLIVQVPVRTVPPPLAIRPPSDRSIDRLLEGARVVEEEAAEAVVVRRAATSKPSSWATRRSAAASSSSSTATSSVIPASPSGSRCSSIAPPRTGSSRTQTSRPRAPPSTACTPTPTMSVRSSSTTLDGRLKPVAERSEARSERVRAHPPVRAVERFDRGHVARVEREAEDIEVLRDA